MMKISEILSKPPFESHPEAQHLSLSDVKDKLCTIYEVEDFENAKGKGVYILCTVDDGKFRYLCTHSVGLYEIFTDPQVREALDCGTVEATFRQKVSEKSGRTFWTVE